MSDTGEGQPLDDEGKTILSEGKGTVVKGSLWHAEKSRKGNWSS